MNLRSGHVDKVIMTSAYKRALKKLVKSHNIIALSKLNRIINELKEFKITSQYHNHPLKNYENTFELHILGDLLLLYRYVDDRTLIISLEALRRFFCLSVASLKPLA